MRDSVKTKQNSGVPTDCNLEGAGFASLRHVPSFAPLTGILMCRWFFFRSTPSPFRNRNLFSPLPLPRVTQPALSGARIRIRSLALSALNPDKPAHGEIAVHSGSDSA